MLPSVLHDPSVRLAVAALAWASVAAGTWWLARGGGEAEGDEAARRTHPAAWAALAVIVAVGARWMGRYRAGGWVTEIDLSALPTPRHGPLDFYVYDAGLPSLVHNLLVGLAAVAGGWWAITVVHAALLAVLAVATHHLARAWVGAWAAPAITAVVVLDASVLTMMVEWRGYGSHLTAAAVGLAVAAAPASPRRDALAFALLALATMDVPLGAALLAGLVLGRWVEAPMHTGPRRLTGAATGFALAFGPLLAASARHPDRPLGGFEGPWRLEVPPTSEGPLAIAALVGVSALLRGAPRLGGPLLGIAVATWAVVRFEYLPDLHKYDTTLLLVWPVGIGWAARRLAGPRDDGLAGALLAGTVVAAAAWGLPPVDGPMTLVVVLVVSVGLAAAIGRAPDGIVRVVVPALVVVATLTSLVGQAVRAERPLQRERDQAAAFAALVDSLPDGPPVRCVQAPHCAGVGVQLPELWVDGWWGVVRRPYEDVLPPRFEVAIGEPACVPGDARRVLADHRTAGGGHGHPTRSPPCQGCEVQGVATAGAARIELLACPEP